ncbi:hypothetical protein BT69DRAFT_1315351 [Atractiella rhizophila]|nr:hypothetical protein BT69DRAFT_1315351 [Atractiella rhizophila]
MLSNISRTLSLNRRTSPAPSPSPPDPSYSEANHNPLDLFGQVSLPSTGILLLPGRSRESAGMTRVVLQENHIRFHIFFNDEGFHNHTAHHILASYSMGAKAELIKDIYDLHEPIMKAMLPLQPIEVTEQNWKDFLGDETFYPNFLAFFTAQIATYGAVAVLEKYLSDSAGQLLARSVSGAIHPLIHFGYGVEFGLDAITAEGLAQAAVHDPQVARLFPPTWPPASTGGGIFSKISSTITSSFAPTATNPLSNISELGFPASLHHGSGRQNSSEKQSEKEKGEEVQLEREMTELGASGEKTSAGTTGSPQPPPPKHRKSSSGSISRPSHTRARDSISFKPPFAPTVPQVSFVQTSLRMPRSPSRLPRYGLSAFTILSHIQNDPLLGPGQANKIDDFPRLDKALNNRAAEIREYCENWIIDAERGWEEIVEKCEELFWVATIVLAASTRPGKPYRLDFFLMHGLTSVLFLPSLLENLSPHLRPHVLTSHFRVLVAYWVSRGRPKLWIRETVMAATDTPLPPSSTAPSDKTAVRRKLEKQIAEQNQNPELAPSPENVPLPSTPEPSKAESQTTGSVNHTNVWGAILCSAAEHPDEHLTKTIRSLAFADSMWGTTPAGAYRCSLDGTDVMDGSIFVRVAGMCMSTLGWVREGAEEGDWDRSVLGFDAAWEEESQE